MMLIKTRLAIGPRRVRAANVYFVVLLFLIIGRPGGTRGGVFEALPPRWGTSEIVAAPSMAPGRPKRRARRPKRPTRGTQEARDASGTLFGATGHPRRVSGPILDRFWVPQGSSRHRFSKDFCDDFRSIQRASWPANGSTLDGSAH